MAQRRMFSLKITNSDRFTEMPLSSQCLYFHLSMNADDDGFIDSVNRIRRMIGASEDDLRLLLSKGFVIPFESGICVIRHWRIHNYIQNDRYTPTMHSAEKRQLIVDNNNEKGAYIPAPQESEALPEPPVNSDDNKNVSKMDTQVRLGKGRTGKGKTAPATNVAVAVSAHAHDGGGDDDDTRPNFDTVEIYAANNLQVLSPGNMAELSGFMDDLPEDVIRYAIDCAAAQGKRTWAYVRSILRSWLDQDIKTLGDAKAESETRRKNPAKSSRPSPEINWG